MPYFAFIGSELEYISAAWNTVKFTPCIRRKFTALSHKRFIQGIQYHYYNLWGKVILLTLLIRRRHSDALFLILSRASKENRGF
jgi:hypothetical protein